MILINFFLRKKTLISTANIAKERLQIIVAKRKSKLIVNSPNYFPELKNDLLQVIRKYMQNPQIVSIQLKKDNEDTSILKCDFYFSNKKYENK